VVPAICYPAVYNLIDFPVGVVPITRVNDQDQAPRNRTINLVNLVLFFKGDKAPNFVPWQKL
jgi:hypothetical protein